MKNASIRIRCEVLNGEGELVQETLFGQYKLQDPMQLLEIQQKAVLPMAQAIISITSGWMQAAIEQAKGNSGSA